ncbi:hypothetical protein SAMN02745216_04599 [Desulfatibacillum alkenivorans DSM 16219]|jgi:hypothetical protein|uniref:Uncharacterized protein n=1 Tax=Desulfatibacillum alkenivorans DSM 16219 TaxID=1121393 RepID=A0A1M6XSA2_9BACT|nr:hypothetical protein [Desulfatibacillum alkenivorans]SHL08778.1 hypothetical protein SAMN02745216_04599 [Desulfatibacillum alkenivorans DSM 16219]
MKAFACEKVVCPDGIWIISEGRYRDLDLRLILEGAEVVTVKEYRISDLAYYMLGPKPIEVKKRLVGCEVHEIEPFSNRFKAKIKRVLPRFMHGMFKERPMEPQILMSPRENTCSALDSKELEKHLERIESQLRPYNSVIKQVNGLDLARVKDIVGICEDFGKNRSQLLIKGCLEDKVAYIAEGITLDVGVTLDRAYVANGLFEMGAYDFDGYDNQKSYRLVTFMHRGETKAFVLDDDNRVKFEVQELDTIQYIQLLENCLRINPKMKEAMDQCMEGKAMAAKILFNHHMEIGYSTSRIPEIYRQAFETYDIGLSEMDAVMHSLNTKQFGIAFSYIPKTGDEQDKVFTTISVMHDFKALDSIKAELPELYSEISKMTSVSDAGTYYLLDAIRGVQ